MRTDSEMYGPVARWLRGFLRGRHPRSRVVVADSHSSYLSQTLRRLGLASRFPEADLWQVKVDIVGVALSRKKATLAIVECKARRPTLKDVCQLLGYSRLMRPDLALLLSPSPPSDPLARLLVVHGRYDILDYGGGTLRIARWLAGRDDIDHASLLPRGMAL